MRAMAHPLNIDDPHSVAAKLRQLADDLDSGHLIIDHCGHTVQTSDHSERIVVTVHERRANLRAIR